MRKYIITLITCLSIISGSNAIAQTDKAKPDAIEDTTIGIKPFIRIENVSPAGHCDNLQLTFIAPWADHFEISKRRSDTAWIKDIKPVNTWFSQTLKPGVNGIIYKRLEEQGSFQFVVKAYKGNQYRESDTITRKPCNH